MDTTGPLARFLDFTALLRRAGFAVAPEQTMAWLAAIELLGPFEVEDIRRAARATLAPQPERIAEFDAGHLPSQRLIRRNGLKTHSPQRRGARLPSNGPVESATSVRRMSGRLERRFRRAVRPPSAEHAANKLEEGVEKAFISIAESVGVSWASLRQTLREEGRYHIETY